jgi:membrane protein implicated in regulation of membrane protease activity
MLISGSFTPWAWAIAAIVIAFLELHAPGNYLIWIACAAAITSVLSFLTDASVSAQLLTFHPDLAGDRLSWRATPQ